VRPHRRFRHDNHSILYYILSFRTVGLAPFLRGGKFFFITARPDDAEYLVTRLWGAYPVFLFY
jgi:hypothetical protein